jgi:superfamily II DNA or RNA helicase/very-short-patch-repair endonuclease
MNPDITEHRESFPAEQKLEALDSHSSPASKIALFRSLFRGREDVYPRRFESRKTGRGGYQPACGNEWVRGVCRKPKIKCSACPNQRFLPVTDDVVGRHLTGDDEEGREFVMGVYPMLLDETCFFLAIDFDNSGWKGDVAAVLSLCRELKVPAVLERSRSGEGGHIWIFFREAVPATQARKLGAFILTETMEQRPEIGLDSYDRFFPNQDTLPKGGFGNLIALPLQKRPRACGHSVFLQDDFEPFPDQWAFLSGIRKVSRAEVENLVGDAVRRDRIMGLDDPRGDEDDETPWTTLPSRRRKDPPIAGPLPESLELVLGNEVYFAKGGLVPGLRNRLMRLAAFQNPEFYKAQAMRLPTYGKPRVIACAEESSHHFGLPRGCLEDVQKLLSTLRIKAVVRDERYHGAPLSLKFSGTLRPEQRKVVEALSKHDTGVLSATTAFGKTVVAAKMIALREVSTLILVHRQQLMEQWVSRLAAFLDIPEKSIGRIGGGRKTGNGNLDVALIQSLVRKGVVDDRVGEYGHLIVDECHHLPAASFEQVARRAKSKYVLGLSATVVRKDGHHPIITMQCGPVRYRVDAKKQAALHPFRHVVVTRPTSFNSIEVNEADQRVQYSKVCEALVADEDRNRLICDDVIGSVKEGRSPLVLTERTEHLDKLSESLCSKVQNLIVLRGGLGKRQLNTLLAELSSIPEDEERILMATGKYIGEGFDDARLDTLFLAMPVSWRGTIVQYVGRLHRLHDLKKEVRVYDYADLNDPMLARMFDRRCKGYEAVGYSIQLPASAVPGWPTDVPLPVDVEWKRNYAASIRRLIRDGVDTPLADLFVHAARRVEPEMTGVDRARSATEKFLYRRLETISGLAGRFSLNVAIPIPFGGSGKMEVDLLCKESRVAIELDGPHHFENAQAYRRDRRKDALLQEHGYFVLRFLAEDVGKELDHVLDTILRTLAAQSRKL